MSPSVKMKLDYRVLIVEDSRDQAKLFAELLKYTFATDVVHSASEALVRLGCGYCPADGEALHCEPVAPFDAILLDINLSNGAGKELVLRFRASFPGVPIVAISGYHFSAQEMINAGAHDFIAKPASKEEILEKLTHTIARNRAWKKVSPMREIMEPMKECLSKAMETSEGSVKSWNIGSDPTKKKPAV